ncbi:MAG: substrate-binding domain-containing protein [Candidatus Caldarchaeum sp.]
MGKIDMSVALAATLILSVGLFSLLVIASLSEPPAAVVYSAPTLRGVSDELVGMAGVPLDVQVHGSVFAANLIKSGKVPDLFLSVDSELKEGLNYKTFKLIGVYRLVLVCAKNFQGLDSLRAARIGIADPNQAPIGYRALAAMYLISEREGLGIVQELESKLNVKFVSDGNSVRIIASEISPSGRFFMRPNLDVVGSLLESGAVDCIFAHIPFVIARNLFKDYSVMELPEYTRFDTNPPIDMSVQLKSGVVKIIRFEAVALSFSEKGDKLIRLIDRIDVSKYGIVGV